MLHNYYQNTNPIEPGLTRYVVKYSGFGIHFRTDVDAKDKAEAKEYFKTYYPRATFISIRKK